MNGIFRCVSVLNNVAVFGYSSAAAKIARINGQIFMNGGELQPHFHVYNWKIYLTYEFTVFLKCEIEISPFVYVISENSVNSELSRFPIEALRKCCTHGNVDLLGALKNTRMQ